MKMAKVACQCFGQDEQRHQTHFKQLRTTERCSSGREVPHRPLMASNLTRRNMFSCREGGYVGISQVFLKVRGCAMIHSCPTLTGLPA